MAQLETQKKSICFLTPALVLGGVERVLVDTMPLLTPYYKVTILTLHGTPEKMIADALEAAGATIVAPNLPVRSAYLLVPFLSRFYYEKILKTIDYDYLICVNNAAMNAGYNKKAKKTVCWNHMDIIHKYVSVSSVSTKIKKSIFKKLYRRYDAIWTVCNKIKTDFEEAFRLEKVQILPNPLDYDSIFTKASAPCDIVFDKTGPNVVTIGRLCGDKAFDRLINSWDNILQQAPNAKLYVIGDGDTKPLLEKLISAHNLSESVFLLGKKENPYPYLKQADLFVCPSREESFGLVILEAMALGIPVITTATAGGKYTTKEGTLATCVEIPTRP